MRSIDENLRHGGQKRGGEPGELGPFARSLEKRFQILRKKCDVFTGAIFQNEGKSTGSADYVDRR